MLVEGRIGALGPGMWCALAIFASCVTGRVMAQCETWQPVGGGVDGTVEALLVYDGDLIVGGAFTTAGSVTVNRIARWDGTNFHAMDGGMDGNVLALVEHNGDLIAGGAFTTAGGQSAQRIARWDGSAWHPIGGGLASTVSALTVHNGVLTAGISDQSSQVQQWNGASWQSLGGSLGSFAGGTVLALEVYNGDLYAAGSFQKGTQWPDLGGINRIARWDGASWIQVGTGTNQTVYALTVHDGDLLLGGQFTSPYNRVARWTGSGWLPAGSGFTSTVYALGQYNGDLIAGGQFFPDVSQPYNRIARWDGATWHEIDGGMANGSVNAIAAYQGALIAGGSFTSAGSSQIDRIAQLQSAAVVGQPPVSVIVTSGGTAVFDVAAVSADPGPFTYQWRRNGVPLVDDARISGSTTNTLTIDPVEPGDVAAYDVEISNACGSTLSDEAVLAVTITCPADLDFNGVVNVFDLLDLLAQWGPCP